MLINRDFWRAEILRLFLKFSWEKNPKKVFSKLPPVAMTTTLSTLGSTSFFFFLNYWPTWRPKLNHLPTRPQKTRQVC